ncbi:lysophospholipid acyltransferase family protein [Candidatus Omnitrophota bacterium]
MPIEFLKNKKLKKRLERWFGRQWVKLITLATYCLTINRARRIGRVFGIVGFCVITRHRRSALRNINMIYKNKKTKQQLRKIIQNSFINAACFGWEVLHLYTHKTTDQEIDSLITKVEGLQHLRKVFKRGRGVIALGAHLGNFALIGRKLNSLGIPNTTIMRQMRDGQLEGIFSAMRARFGQRSILKFPLAQAIKESITWLKNGNLLMVYVDQRSGRGVKADFMGLPTPTPTGAAVFALKTGAAVLPIMNVRNGNGKYKLIIGKEVEVLRSGDRKKDIFTNTQNFNKIIEQYIFRYPEQWFWFHNRWKGVKQHEV